MASTRSVSSLDVSHMRIGVMGAGSVGCYVGGKLLAAARDVTFVGRDRIRREVSARGLTLKELDADPVTVEAERVTFETSVDALAGCEIILVCVKSAQTAAVAAELASVLAEDAVVVSLQNGVRNPDILHQHLGDRRVVAGIVGFNVVSRGRATFHRTMSGPIALEGWNEPRPLTLVDGLREAGLDVETHADIAPEQWTKLLVNLNNAVSALSGAPTAELLATKGYRRVIAALVAEGRSVLRAARIRPAKLRGVPVGLMPWVLRMPTPIVRAVTRRQVQVDAEARSSMWEDLTKGRPTEVDYLNGEIVRLAREVGTEAPLNERVVALVHRAEKDRGGSPQYDPETLWGKLGA